MTVKDLRANRHTTVVAATFFFMTMVSLFGATAFRRGPAAVTAFSFATFSGPGAAAARAAAPSSASAPRVVVGRSSAVLGSAAPFMATRSFGLRQSSSSSSDAAVAAPPASSAATSSSSSLTKAQLEKSLEVTHPAYEMIKNDVVSEYGAYCTLYRHKKSGAELLSVATDDDNKVFGITLRTPPDDSTGVPHILEHSVLCGSRKYVTKDPFVHLLKGSLQTFLNAFTYPDRTCYVVASQNLKDFYNLINVYTDAVYFPRAVSDPLVHSQEGWHLELDDKEHPLIYKGVVYNEMKGVYSSPDSLLNRAAQRSVFPDNTYAVDSGGDPKVIPDLSFEQFRDFHRKFYHPANSRIYFSGDDDVYSRLELMDEYLREFDETPDSRVQSKVEWQPKNIAEPRKEVRQYPAAPDQPETHMLMMNWLVNDRPMTSLEELTLGILDHLLLGTTSAVLRKTLMESGLGDAVTGGGLSEELLQSTYSVGLKGVKGEAVDSVEQLILDTLEKVAREGFTDDDIASSMNTIEFQMREFNTGSFPRGLSFMLGAMSKWLYDESPTDGLKFEEPLAQLKAKIAESGSMVFQDMVKEFLVDNTHRTTVQLAPSKTLEEETVKEEEDRLSKIRSKLSDAELEDIITKTNELKAIQAAEDSPEATATIPSLELNDLKREAAEYPIAVTENENDSGVTVVRHEMGSTSGIAYVNFGVDLSNLPVEDIPLLPLFTMMMMETGAGEYDSVALSRRIGTHTGGVNADLMLTAVYPEGQDESVAQSGENMMTKLMIHGKSTSDKTDELFTLFKLVLTDAHLDSQSKVIEMLKETRSQLESRIQGAGHSMANSRMSARHRPAGYVAEITGGISYLDTVKSLLEQAQNDWPSLLSRLESIRATLLDEATCRNGMVVDITGDSKVLETIQPSVERFISGLPGDSKGKKAADFCTSMHPWVPELKKQMAEMAPIADEGFVVPTQVSYVGKSGLLYDEGEKISGSASVVARFLRTGYLWDYVRVIGGAYGGFCTFSPYSGFFSFLSYRDPNLDKTIDVYDNAADYLMEAADSLEKDPEALATAIIGTIGDKDSALSADQKGYKAFERWMINESPEYRQSFRDEILATTPDDFRDFAKRLKKLKDPSVAVISSKSAFEAAAKAGKVMDVKEIF